jgi:putative ABC transport system permease protein
MRLPFWKRNQDHELEAEVRVHLEMAIAARMERGESRAEARAAALREFGNELQVREATRQKWGWEWLEQFGQDIRYGTRVLRKNAGVTALCIVILALGIGANTAIFTIVDATVLRPPAYVHPERLMAIGRRFDRDQTQYAISVPNFRDISEQATSVLESSAAYDVLLSGFNLTTTGAPERLAALHVSANFFQTLGVQPELGRTFAENEDQPGHDNEVLISHRLWESRFASDPAVVGRTLVLNGRPYSVVGILPTSFRFSRDADVWAPLVLETTSHDRKANIIEGLARLRADVTRAAAQSELNLIARRLQQTYPDDNKGLEFALEPLQRRLSGEMRTPMLVLLGAVTLVLLVACANVANLLLAQAARRQREIALRSALGARRGRIVRQLLTESMLLAIAGAGAGLLLAHWATAALVALSPASVSMINVPALDSRVLLFATTLALVTGIVFGSAPALQLKRIELNDTLKEGGRTSAGTPRQRLRSALVISEVAVALVLSVGAGLLIESFARLIHVNPGFDARNVLSLRLPLSETRFKTGADLANYYRKFVPTIASIPGVQSAAAATTLPLDLSPDFPVDILGRALPSDRQPDMILVAVSPAYFETLRIPVIRGRGFTDADTETSERVVVISANAAKRWWPDGDAIGHHIWIGKSMGEQFADTGPRQIVGIAEDVHNDSLRDKPRATTYIPLAQLQSGIVPLLTRLLPYSVAVRTSGDPAGVASSVRKQIWAVDGQQPITDVRPLEELARESLRMERFLAYLIGGFGGLTLILAVAGIYGVIAYAVTQRTNEIGVRMALGATRGRILRMVVADAMRLGAIGIAAGVTLALVLTRSIQGLLFGVRPWDIAMYSAVAVLLALLSVVASLVPAARAVRVDPMVALRYE